MSTSGRDTRRNSARSGDYCRGSIPRRVMPLLGRNGKQSKTEGEQVATIEQTIKAAGFDPTPSDEAKGAGTVELSDGWLITYEQTGPGTVTFELVDTSRDPFEVVREYTNISKPRIGAALVRISGAVNR
jgi:hypothetical protein